MTDDQEWGPLPGYPGALPVRSTPHDASSDRYPIDSSIFTYENDEQNDNVNGGPRYDPGPPFNGEPGSVPEYDFAPKQTDWDPHEGDALLGGGTFAASGDQLSDPDPEPDVAGEHRPRGPRRFARRTAVVLAAAAVVAAGYAGLSSIKHSSSGGRPGAASSSRPAPAAPPVASAPPQSARAHSKPSQRTATAPRTSSAAALPAASGGAAVYLRTVQSLRRGGTDFAGMSYVDLLARGNNVCSQFGTGAAMPDVLASLRQYKLYGYDAAVLVTSAAQSICPQYSGKLHI